MVSGGCLRSSAGTKRLNQQYRQKSPYCWLNRTADHVDDLFSRGAGPAEPLVNDLGIVRLPCSQVERRVVDVEPAVPPDDVRDGFGLDFAFRPLGIVVDVEVEQDR